MDKYNVILDNLKNEIDNSSADNIKRTDYILTTEEKQNLIKNIDRIIKDLKPIVNLFEELE